MSIDGYTTALHRRGKFVLIATAAVMVFSLIGITRLKINASFDVFTPPDSSGSIAISQMIESFGDSDQMLVLAEIGASGSTDETVVASISKIMEELGSLEGVSGIDAPVLASSGAAGIPLLGLSAPTISIAGAEGVVDGDARRYAILRFRLIEGAKPGPVVRSVRNAFDRAGIPVLLSGEPYLQAEIFNYIIRIIVTIPPLAILLMLGVFRLRIGSFRATLLSMVPAIIGAAVTLGGVIWIRGSVSVVSVLVPIFVIVLGSADGLHITSHVIDGLRSGMSNHDAVTSTLKSVGSAIVLTTITTMAGFLSLLLINSGAIRELGFTAAAGILVAGIATWIILPTIVLHQRPLAAAGTGGRERLYRGISRLRGLPGILLPLILIGAFLPGAMKLQTNFSMIDVYRPYTAVRKSIDATTELLGGSIPVYVTARAGEDSGMEVYDSELAQAFIELQDRLTESGVSGRSISLYSIIRDAYAGMTGKRIYPPSAIAKRLVSAVGAVNPTGISSFVADNGTVRAVFFLRDLENDTLDAFLSAVDEVSGARGIPMSAVGAAFLMKEMNDQITKQQFQSLALAVVLVFLLTTITQRNIRLGFASALPIAVTLVVMFGVMGYAGIELSIVTGIMSGLTIGVGIDYAVHFVSLYQKLKNAGAADPTESALGYVATPILANALGLAIGFTAMLLSPLSIHVTLSILMWVTMVTSSVLSLTFLPTIARWFDSGFRGMRRRGGSGA